MLEPVLKNPWVRAVGVLIGIVLVFVLMYILRPVLIPLFMAFLVAYVLDPVVDRFEARKISRGTTIACLGVLGAIILITFPFILGASIVRQANNMIDAVRAQSAAIECYECSTTINLDTTPISDENTVQCPECETVIDLDKTRQGWLNRVADKLPLDEFVRSMGWVDEYGRVVRTESPVVPKAQREQEESSGEAARPALPRPGAAQQDPPDDRVESEGGGDGGPVEEAAEEIVPENPDALAVIAEKTAEAIRNNALQFFRSNAQSIASAGQRAGLTVTGFLGYIGNTIMQTILFVANLALFTFVAGYLLKDFDRIVASAKNLLPRKYAAKTIDIVGQIDDQLRSFLRGQMTVALCLGAMYFIGFMIAGVPFALLLALFGVVASFIPFIGVTLVAIAALALTLMTHQLDWHILGVLATVGLAQFLEGNVLTPKIVGDKVGLNPVWVILAVMVFGNFLGFLGLLLAVPIAASLKVLVVEAVKYYKMSPVFAGGPPVDDDEDSDSGDSE